MPNCNMTLKLHPIASIVIKKKKLVSLEISNEFPHSVYYKQY